MEGRDPRVRVGLLLLHPARPLQGQDLAGVGGDRAPDLPPPPGTAEAGSRSGRRSAVRARDWWWRHAAIAAWSPDSSTGGYVVAAPAGGLGVAGVLEQAVLVGLLQQRLRVAHEPREQPGDRLDDHQRGDLAAVEDVVADRELPDVVGGGVVVGHPLVDALVAAAGDDQVLVGGQLAGDRLRERRAAGGGDDQRRAGREHGVERLAPRLGLHHHPGSAAVRGVVDGAVPVVGPLPQVVDVHGEQAPLPRPACERELEGRR